MSGPDGIDERFGTLLGELRSGEATASPELRERVRAIAQRGPEPPAGHRLARFRRRRLALLLVPVAAAIAAAIGIGAFSSGGTKPNHGSVVLGALNVFGGQHADDAARAPAPLTPQRAAGLNAYSGHSAIAPSGSRAQIYAVELNLRVSDLSGATKQAIQETRGWGGYLVSVDYGSGQKSGTAYLVVRVPIVKVQTAVAKLSRLGTILNDHVSIQDVQGQLNRRFSQMQDLKVKIADLRAKLTDTTLTASQRAFFQATLTRRQAQLASLQQQQSAEKTRVSFATVSLELQTKKAASAAPPSKPGRIGQALHNIGRVLVVEAEILLYVLLIGAPFVVLAALFWASRRTLRRRGEEQLLAR